MTEPCSRTVTVLFTDVERTGDLLKKLGGGDAGVLWRKHYSFLRMAAAARGDHKVENLGDGLMVAFPSVVDALACAADLQRKVDSFNRQQDGEPKIHVRVGLHLGEDVLDEEDYFRMPVVVARQLCMHAAGGQILASEQTRHAIEPMSGYKFREDRPFLLKDLSETIAVWEVVWQVAPEDATELRPIPLSLARVDNGSFIGRGEELSRLHRLWSQARAGQCRLVLLAGEPGIGKTRLAARFAASAHSDGGTILFGHTNEASTLPYHPIAEALHYYLSGGVPGGGEKAAGALLDTLSETARAVARRIPNLGADSSDEGTDEKATIPEGVAELLSGISGMHPTLLVLDDLHWADKETLLLLRHIVASATHVPLLILGTYRSTEVTATHPLSKALLDASTGDGPQQVLVAGLGEDDVTALVGARMGMDAPSVFIDTICKQTEGNPFFIEEVLRHLVETGVVDSGDEASGGGFGTRHISIPNTVREVIDSRLSRLSDECNSVLTVASVIGREFDLETLTRASDLSEEQLQELMEEAVDAQVLTEVPETLDRYRFSHALFYETLYDELTTTRRVRLHGQTLRYADSNGVKLAYEILGGSGPCMIAVSVSNCPAVRSQNKQLALGWDRMSRFCRVILYDRRGVGFSAAPEHGYSLADHVDDLRAVLDSVGVGRAVLWGATDGGPLAITFAVQHPERVAGLILAGTTPKLYNSDGFELGINNEVAESFILTDASDRKRAASEITATRNDSETVHGIVEVMRRVPHSVWSQIVVSAGTADARPLLGQIKAPTLIIHDPDNTYIPVEAAHYLHEHIPESRLEITREYYRAGLLGYSAYEMVQSFIEDVTSRTHQEWDLFNYHFVRARETLMRGNFEQAAVHADMALEMGIEAAPSFPIAMCHLAAAHAVHGLGKGKEADSHIEQALNTARKIRSPNAEFNALWSEAQFAFVNGEDATGLESLRMALSLGKERGYFNTFIEQPLVMASLCMHALEADMDVEYVQELIRQRNLRPDPLPSAPENWPWTLRVYTLGGFQLFIDGKPAHFTRKAQQRPLTMLKALLAYGSRDVKEEQIADAIWPDAEGDMAHGSFTTTLHRLRKLIGHGDVFELREGGLTLDQQSCWVDVWAFEHYLSQADAAWEEEPTETNVRKALALTQRAVDLYRGAFLPAEIWESWTVSPRARLQSKFLRAVGRLGNYWEEHREWRKAIECYRRGLEADDLIEEFYQCLMTCHRNLGQRAEALSVFDRCKRTLFAALGVVPSAETEAIYKTLRTTKEA